MGFYDFAPAQDFDVELEKRYVIRDQWNLRFIRGTSLYNGNNSRISAETRFDAVGASNYYTHDLVSYPYFWAHEYPVAMFGDPFTENKNSVDDPPGSIKTPIEFKFWNRYRGDGTGWQITYGRSINSSCKMQFFSDRANGEHNRMRFLTRGYDQTLFNINNTNTWVWKDHRTLNLWGSGHVSIGEDYTMELDGGNNGTASDLSKPSYHLSVQNGIYTGAFTNNDSRVRIQQTAYDTARSRSLLYAQNLANTKGCGVDQDCNFIFGAPNQYMVFYDNALGVYKKARINNNAWEITNY